MKFITINWSVLPGWIRHPILYIAQSVISWKLKTKNIYYIKHRDPPSNRRWWKLYPPTDETSEYGPHCGYAVWRGHVWAYGYPEIA